MPKPDQLTELRTIVHGVGHILIAVAAELDEPEPSYSDAQQLVDLALRRLRNADTQLRMRLVDATMTDTQADPRRT